MNLQSMRNKYFKNSIIFLLTLLISCFVGVIVISSLKVNKLFLIIPISITAIGILSLSLFIRKYNSKILKNIYNIKLNNPKKNIISILFFNEGFVENDKIYKHGEILLGFSDEKACFYKLKNDFTIELKYCLKRSEIEKIDVYTEINKTNLEFVLKKEDTNLKSIIVYCNRPYNILKKNHNYLELVDNLAFLIEENRIDKNKKMA